MFHSTRLKLTAWYLLLIMFISFVFSVVIFIDVNRELTRFGHFQQLRQERIKEQFGDLALPSETSAYDEQLVYEARSRLIASLVLLNICILAGAGGAAYFLAGRTINPIKKAVEEQSRFIGDASHELKTPLTSLRAEIEVYLRGKKKTTKEAVEILQSNLEEVIKLQGLTDSLMKLASLEHSTKKNFEKVDLNMIIQNAVKSVYPIAKSKNITIIIKPAKLFVIGNEKSLQQLFIILLDNAIKYSLPNKKITVISSIFGGVVSIQVIDQGIGIPALELEHIFNRFYRVDKSRSSFDTPGFGLGLSIAKEIVAVHNGAIFCKSGTKGSEFTVELPA